MRVTEAGNEGSYPGSTGICRRATPALPVDPAIVDRFLRRFLRPHLVGNVSPSRAYRRRRAYYHHPGLAERVQPVQGRRGKCPGGLGFRRDSGLEHDAGGHPESPAEAPGRGSHPEMGTVPGSRTPMAGRAPATRSQPAPACRFVRDRSHRQRHRSRRDGPRHQPGTGLRHYRREPARPDPVAGLAHRAAPSRRSSPTSSSSPSPRSATTAGNCNTGVQRMTARAGFSPDQSSPISWP